MLCGGFAAVIVPVRLGENFYSQPVQDQRTILCILNVLNSRYAQNLDLAIPASFMYATACSFTNSISLVSQDRRTNRIHLSQARSAAISSVIGRLSLYDSFHLEALLVLFRRAVLYQLVQRYIALIHHIAAFIKLSTFFLDKLFAVATVVIETFQIFVIIEVAGFADQVSAVLLRSLDVG